MARKKTKRTAKPTACWRRKLAAAPVATTTDNVVTDGAVTGDAVAETNLPVARTASPRATKKSKKAATPKAPTSKGRTAESTQGEHANDQRRCGQAPQAERPGCGRQGARGSGPAHELPRDDRGHGRQGLLDLARGQDPRSHSLFRPAARDQNQGQPSPLPESRTRPVRLPDPQGVVTTLLRFQTKNLDCQPGE